MPLARIVFLYNTLFFPSRSNSRIEDSLSTLENWAQRCHNSFSPRQTFAAS